MWGIAYQRHERFNCDAEHDQRHGCCSRAAPKPVAGSRARIGGLLAVLCFLAGFSLLTENDLAARAAASQRATQLGQLYGDARFWVGQEESLERKYRLEPSPAVLQLHAEAEKSLSHDLDAIGSIDHSAETQQLVKHLHREQRLYAQASEQMFDAVEQHNAPLVIHYDTGSSIPSSG